MSTHLNTYMQYIPMHATHKLIKVKRNFQRQTDTWRDTSSGIKRSRKKKRKQKEKTGKNRDRKKVPEKQRDLEMKKRWHQRHVQRLTPSVDPGYTFSYYNGNFKIYSVT